MLEFLNSTTSSAKNLALDALRANVMIADENLNIIYMNAAVTQLLREAEAEIRTELPSFSVATLIGSNIDVFHKNPGHQRNMLKQLDRPHSASIKVGKHIFDLRVVPLMKGAKRIGFAVEWADAKEERLRMLDYAAQVAALGRSQAIISFTVDGQIIDANDNFLNTLGYRLDEIQGKHHRMFVDPEYAKSPEYQDLWRKLNAGEFVAAEFKRIGKGGKEVWIQASYNPILDDKGKVTKVVKFATDVTDRVFAVNQIGAGLTNLAEADLSHKIDQSFGPAFEKLRRDYNLSVQKLGDTMQGVLQSVNAITSAGQEITTASDDLSRRTEQQAASLEETAASLEMVSATMRKTAEGAKHARDVVVETRDDAERSGKVLDRTVEAMGKIEKSSREISQIIGVIDEIAFQTNLLALNAGVEAARAGDAGKGFAVVASEVRALAQRAAEAAKQIKALITTSNGEVSNGVKLVAETGDSLNRIAFKVAKINNVVNEITAGAQEQATALQEINTAVNQMDQTTQQNAAMAEEATAATHSLSNETDNLSTLVAQFKLAQPADESLLHGQRATMAASRVSNAKARTPRLSSAHAPVVVMKATGPRGGAALKREWEEF